MNKQIFPEAVRWPYPFFADMRLNLWALVAIGSAITVRWWRHESVGQIGPSSLAISLVPLIPAHFYARRLIRRIADLDEMQRRMQQDALVFAAMWTIFLRMALDLAHGSGYLDTPRFSHGLGVEGTFAAMCLLYMLGCAIANRRYR